MGAALLALVVMVSSSLTYQEQRYERELDDWANGVEGGKRKRSTLRRFVDIGVHLWTVVQDDKRGERLLPGKPLLRKVDDKPITWGGLLDRRTKQIVGPTRRPVVWYASPEQTKIILHADAEPLGQLIYGSEGGGKTATLPRWHHRRWVENLGQDREGGQVAPTLERLNMFYDAFRASWHPDWYRYVPSKRLITLADGSRIRLVSAHKQSEDQGSPIQGYNWSWAGGDEAQDFIRRWDDIEARGRAAPVRRGIAAYKQARTATAKDNTDWRDARDRLLAAPHLWVKRKLLGKDSPFVVPGFWEQMGASMSEREYKRRVLAEDVGPERATYPSWDRERNLITVPQIGWVNVTEDELRAYGPNRALLGGHDPGTLVDVTLLLHAFVPVKDEHAYRRGLKRPFWVVRDEVNSETSTTEQHIIDLLKVVREKYQLNHLSRDGKINPHGRQMLLRADPAGNNDSRTDKSVYTQFANAGVHIKPAAYNATNDGHGRVHKDAGIELVNTLLCAANGERRLFVEKFADGRNAAPRLVKTLESSERDGDGRAETQKKDERDVSHWGAALRYALWAIERPRLKLAIGDAT